LLKDMRAVEAFADGLGLDLPVVRAAAERVDAYVARGHATDDSVSVIRLYRGDP
jgi:3-hydroxyisobutyrate dehydrogenase-like beta-hydroxyacid dehydrogenase